LNFRAVHPPDTIEAINGLAAITSSGMAADPLTTISVHESTRTNLQRLKSAGQSYDQVIRTILEELEERDPWFAEMEKRVVEWKAGKIKLEPIETLWDKDKKARARKST
jgi:predicted CopG family antitoxin